MSEPVERWVFCEACGEAMQMPRSRTVHLLCGACRVLPRQWPMCESTKPATFRELLGLREEPRRRMLGECWQ